MFRYNNAVCCDRCLHIKTAFRVICADSAAKHGDSLSARSDTLAVRTLVDALCKSACDDCTALNELPRKIFAYPQGVSRCFTCADDPCFFGTCKHTSITLCVDHHRRTCGKEAVRETLICLRDDHGSIFTAVGNDLLYRAFVCLPAAVFQDLFCRAVLFK